MISDLKFKSLIHFEFIFMRGIIRSQFDSSACGYPVFSTSFIEDYPFPH